MYGRISRPRAPSGTCRFRTCGATFTRRATSVLRGRSWPQGGKRRTLQRVTFAGTTKYANYVVHRDATFEVTDPSGGSTELRVCGSFIEKDGGWKVFSYVVDDD